MTRSATVAVVRSDNRRGAVAQALALIADDLRVAVTPDVLIKPCLDSHRRQLASTHADALSAVLDAVLAAGGRRVVVAEGAGAASGGFDRLGFRKEAFGRPVTFFDLDREESAWEPVEPVAGEGNMPRTRISRTVASATCRVSLAPARTHASAMLALSLVNMMSTVHPDDRREGSFAGPLSRDNLSFGVLSRLSGRFRRIRAILSGKSRISRSNFTRAELGYLRSFEARNRDLVALTHAVKPHLAVVDGFVAMQREGPMHGSPIQLGTIVAGSDAVAVDAVASAVMGFDPMRVAYLRYAHEAGFGVADLGAIEVAGDPIASVRRACVPHSNHLLQRHWDRLPESTRGESAIPAPHVVVNRASEPSRR